jgi:hypothetical protein
MNEKHFVHDLSEKCWLLSCLHVDRFRLKNDCLH